MMASDARYALAIEFGRIASIAGQIVMSGYRSGVAPKTKSDNSPVTSADTEAERVIRQQLAAVMPGTPIIAEESFDPGQSPHVGDRFLLVDPLDGTREFVAENDEFTVNIALIEFGHPIAACVFAPALNRMYLAGAIAFRAEVHPGHDLPPPDAIAPIATSGYPAAGLRALISRSHRDSASDGLLRQLPLASQRSVGSSLKFCLIAQGDADIYPRLAPTMEWDIAAGHAVLAAAGGCVLARDGLPMTYGKTGAGFRNDGFVAWGRSPIPLR